MGWNVTVHRESEREKKEREVMQFERVRVCGCIHEGSKVPED